MKQILVLLFIILLISVFSDMYHDKIPNWLILAGILTGIIATDDLMGSIIRFLMICLFFFPFFSIGALGAGDVKCIAMTVFYLRADQLIQSIFYIFIIAAIFSLFKVISYEKGVSDNETINHHTIHLALPIFLGVLLSVGGTFL